MAPESPVPLVTCDKICSVRTRRRRLITDLRRSRAPYASCARAPRETMKPCLHENFAALAREPRGGEISTGCRIADTSGREANGSGDRCAGGGREADPSVRIAAGWLRDTWARGCECPSSGRQVHDEFVPCSNSSDPVNDWSLSLTDPYKVISQPFSMSAFCMKPIDDPAASRRRQDAPRTRDKIEPQARSGLAEKRQLSGVASAPDADKMMQPHLESQLYRRRLVENPGRQPRHLRTVRHLPPQP